MEASDLATTEFHKTLDALDLTQCRIARLFNVSARHIRRWRSGARRVPHAVGIVCNLLAIGEVTIDQVERAAAGPVPRTNGAKPESPAPRVEPKQSALVCAETAALADPSLAIAEKIVALAPNACRWPHGDPRDHDFFFCGRATVREPYCEAHRAAAHTPQPSLKTVSVHRPRFRPSTALTGSLAPAGTHECPAHLVAGEKQTSAARNSSCF
jgi:GcrA cell cycle regulator